MLSQHILKGIVLDKTNNKPIPYVIIIFNDNKKQVLTDNEGAFSLVLNSFELPILFTKLGFESLQFLPKQHLKDTGNLVIYLKEKPNQLKEVEVASEKITPVVKNKSFYIHDYSILPNKNFLLITYRLNSKHFDVVLSNSNNKIIFKRSISNEEPFKIFDDCLGNKHIVTDKYSRQIMSNSDSTFFFLEPISRSKFDSIIRPCATKIENELFFFTLNSPGTIQGSFEGFDVKVNSNIIFYYKIKNRKIKPVRFITYNPKIQKMMNDELKNEMDRWSLGLNVFYHSIQEMENERSNAYSVIFKEIYAPVFSKNDTVVLFNFPEMQIEYYDKEGSRLGQIKIDDKSFNELHDFEVMMDPKTLKFYIFNKENDKKYLNEISIYNGKLLNKYKLEKPLAAKIRIYDDFIYYIVKETEWDDTSYLYSQRK
jgi:hypothetical protein